MDLSTANIVIAINVTKREWEEEEMYKLTNV